MSGCMQQVLRGFLAIDLHALLFCCSCVCVEPTNTNTTTRKIFTKLSSKFAEMKSIIKREVDEHHRLIDDFLLRELTLNSGKHVASLMINDKSLHNKASLVLLSKKIFNGIALKNDSSSKYLELAKNVVHMFYKSGRNKKELREFFVELLEEEFRKFQSAENNAFVLLYSKFFLDDQLSPEVILKFLQLLDDHPVNLQTSTIISLMKYRGTGRTSSSQHLDDMDDMVDIWNITGDPTVDHGLILK